MLKAGCTKFGLNPTGHSLEHKDKAVDLSLPFRLSSIPQNATVNIVVSISASSIVKVAITWNGSRLMGEFDADRTLISIIEHWVSENKVTPFYLITLGLVQKKGMNSSHNFILCLVFSYPSIWRVTSPG